MLCFVPSLLLFAALLVSLPIHSIAWGADAKLTILSRVAKGTLLGIAIGQACTDIIPCTNNNPKEFQIIAPVHADSTGKFSTKLTARKRYLPKIVAGLQTINAIGDGASIQEVDSFVAEDLPKLERAMSLYGYSLRKGENPDDTSRTADLLTKAFVAEAKKLSTATDLKSQLQAMRSAYENYLQFAKIEKN